MTRTKIHGPGSLNARGTFRMPRRPSDTGRVIATCTCGEEFSDPFLIPAVDKVVTHIRKHTDLTRDEIVEGLLGDR